MKGSREIDGIYKRCWVKGGIKDVRDFACLYLRKRGQKKQKRKANGNMASRRLE